jgi:hypothetical protein
MTRGWVRTPGYQAFWTAAAIVTAAAVIMGVVDPAPPLEPGWDPYAVWWLAGCLVVAARSWFLGVQVTDDAVIVRNFYRTRRLSRAEVVAVQVSQYDGLLIPLGSWYWATVRIGLSSSRDVFAHGLVGRRAVARRAATELRTLCGIEQPTPSRSHRA